MLNLRVGEKLGSAFLFDHGDQQYLATANHMVDGLARAGKVALLNDETWIALDVTVLHGDSPCVDFAVLVPRQKHLMDGDGVDVLKFGDYFIGQEVYFLGFPYGLGMRSEQLHVTSPFVKHGYVSAVVPCSAIYPGGSPKERLIMLDGFNNPGFSGGPVVTPDLKSPGRPFKVTGIVSAYKNEELPVNIRGSRAEGVTAQSNTGIVITIGFDQVLKLIADFLEQRELKKP